MDFRDGSDQEQSHKIAATIAVAIPQAIHEWAERSFLRESGPYLAASNHQDDLGDGHSGIAV